MSEYIVLKYFTGDFIEKKRKYDYANVQGPYHTLEKAVKSVIKQMGDVFTPCVSYHCVDDGPLQTSEYTPEITEEEVTDILFETRSYEIFGKKYEIRELTPQ